MKEINFTKFFEDNPYLNMINEVDVSEKTITTDEVARVGISLSGEFQFFPQNRIQLFGLEEYNYLKNKIQKGVISEYLSHKIPLIIFSRGNVPDQEFLYLATKNKIPVCISEKSTSKIFSKVFNYLEYELAPETTIHGVMLNIYGKGVIIRGKSGIGKSEVALELIKKGHILVADDMVILKQLDLESLVGEAPDILKSKMEIRGIGIVDIQKLYGVTSVMLKADVDLIVELTEEISGIDRIGRECLHEEYLDVKVRKVKIPILKGKSISNLIEVAVANYQLEQDYGYDAADEFVNNLNKKLQEN